MAEEATDRRGTARRTTRRVGVFGVCLAAGVLFASSAVTSKGSDLRPSGQDLGSVVEDRARIVEEQRRQAADLVDEIERLTDAAPTTEGLTDLRGRIASLGALSGFSESTGPGVRVTLDDAPRGADPEGVDPNLLVVHEQDIRAFVNALWSGGAEAVSLQGQRIIATSSITCVGSTVVIDGVPYSPPYEIAAVGDVGGMTFSLSTSSQVSNFKRYAERYGLGLTIDSAAELTLPAHDGSTGLVHATALRRDARPSDD